ncbi:MAG: ATP-binding cassette domain-containing protein [Rhodospirillaceae bacterium]|jgi:peptide/nickel transport system ATP-binding protein|nr:ATP-binding cassette domain-containing protein [Rhodospirillaceae bacterium]MBT4589645.1 ATP-binding cassette domain-containing protein [Rhodospirillaceae bacterium]MBT4941111.1 ATP-binding cassette domain-containing protein [Rhodospirillaceae bacterium]MBT5940727.1 ATP-binding cassette domain-containing protein [Rhodospirillaceae bacterium]MBT7267048.1 ATP-binding cassette domain-containing protein [Rhodospirillaceae bacterium]
MPDSTNTTEATLLEVRDITVEYVTQGQRFAAISDVSMDIAKGETLGLVGESGCGKSTTGRAIIQLPTPTAGSVKFEGRELTELTHTDMRPIRKRLQIIFQDPVSSLNPRRRVKDIVAEPLIISGMTNKAEIDAKVREVLNAVGMDPDITLDRRPHQFSGGQCQRICIARSLIMEPNLIVCDEPVSALDVSVQAQILNLLEDMKERYGLTLLFISHDLAVVKNISDRVAVMYLGKFCELASSERIYEAPAHPYTAGLMATIPEIGDKSIDNAMALTGEIPSPLNPPSGCRFRTRCPHAQEKCAAEEPAFSEIEPGHQVACHFPLLGE